MITAVIRQVIRNLDSQSRCRRIPRRRHSGTCRRRWCMQRTGCSRRSLANTRLHL